MKRIALDDGHGMQTAGKRTPFIPEINRFIHENEFNRVVVRLLDAELTRCGFDTVLTAPTDADTPLATRVKVANNARADLFISVHYNALDGKFDGNDPEGFSAHIDPSGGKSQTFAQIAIKHLSNGTLQKNRGVVKQQLYVTANTKMPAVLFELGFMDNSREALLMIDKAFQRECAVELAMAVCEYYNVPYKGSALPQVTKPVPVKPQVVKPPSSAVKVGSLITKQDVPAYARPEWGTQTGRVVQKGQTRHVYARKNGWYQLFSGEWLPAQSGDNFDFIPVKKSEPPTVSPAAKLKMKRVIVDGKQVGAFAADEGVVHVVSQALAEKAKKIEVEEV